MTNDTKEILKKGLAMILYAVITVTMEMIFDGVSFEKLFDEIIESFRRRMRLSIKREMECMCDSFERSVRNESKREKYAYYYPKDRERRA